MRTVVVTGATGVVGRSAAAAFEAAGWRVLALSRRDPKLTATGAGEIVHLPVDLSDREACRAALSTQPPASHLVYAAVEEAPGLVAGWNDAAQMQRNLSMLRHVLDPLCETGALEHVSTLQGGKAYGAHLHAVPLPAREDGPRDPHPNFYWLHEDAVREAAARHRFGWTVLRPPVIGGGAVGAAMNPVLPIAALGTIARAQGKALGFPGGAAKAFQMVDARVVADALLWAADASAARDQIFNIDNGDLAEWRAMWPAIAAALGVEAGEDAPGSIAALLSGESEAWTALASEHGLAEPDLSALLGQSHHYADILLMGSGSGAPPLYLSPIKIRRAGFTPVMDSLETMLFWIGDLRRRGYLPPL